MKNKAIWTDRLLAILITLVVLAGAALAVAAYTAPGMKTLSPAISSFFVLRPESVTEEAIPGYAGVRRVYSFDLGKYPYVSGRSLYVYLRHTYATLDLDGTLRADTGEDPDTPHIGHTPGNYWLSLPISEDNADCAMTVTLTPAYQSVREVTPTFYLIGRQPLLTMLLAPKEGALIALGLVAVTAGFFLMLLALSLRLERGDRQRAFFLGAVTLSAGLWKLSGMSFVPLVLDFYGKQKAIWFVGALSYLLMMVLSLRLLTVLRDGGNKRLGKVCCFFAAGAALLLSLTRIPVALRALSSSARRALPASSAVSTTGVWRPLRNATSTRPNAELNSQYFVPERNGDVTGARMLRITLSRGVLLDAPETMCSDW